MGLENEFEVIINQLRTGELEQYVIKKENFPTFRNVLINQVDKEKIRGEAQKGGDIIYTFVQV